MATDCSLELIRTVPLYRVVNAAIIDMHEDIGRLQQVCSHHAARGLRQLDKQTLKTGMRKVTLTVNQNTNTATLPPDFDYELGVWVIVNNKRVLLKVRPEILDLQNIDNIPCVDKCAKCNQDKSICEELTITEDTILVTINDLVYEQTIIKKLYPNGDYFLETRIPVLNIESNVVEYNTNKEFIVAIDLKPCGCIEETESNIQKIQNCCPDVWCSHFSQRDNSCVVNYGGYRVFEDTGFIQFDGTGFSKCYMEYWGFMPKKNGQYQVPEIAFEPLVEWTKLKWVRNKRNIPLKEREMQYNDYRMACGNMRKIIGRISISQIVQAIGLIPKFDLDGDSFDFAGCSSVPTVVMPPIAQAVCAPVVNTGAVCPTPSPKGLTPFQLAVVAGNGSGTPQAGVNVYQNDALKGAIGLNNIIVNNGNESILAKQFTFDATSGTITRYQGDGITPNNWVAGDILIASFSKFI